MTYEVGSSKLEIFEMAQAASRLQIVKKPEVKISVTPVKGESPKPAESIKKTKDGWEMSAREALQVNFVESES